MPLVSLNIFSHIIQYWRNNIHSSATELPSQIEVRALMSKLWCVGPMCYVMTEETHISTEKRLGAVLLHVPWARLVSASVRKDARHPLSDTQPNSTNSTRQCTLCSTSLYIKIQYVVTYTEILTGAHIQCTVNRSPQTTYAGTVCTSGKRILI